MEMEQVQPHCPGPGPGPPKAIEAHRSRMSSTGNMDDIQQLRNELQLCHGKIKGYEILGQLFQESKQECSRYKMQNEELMKRIENLTTSHMFSSSVVAGPSEGVSSSTYINNCSAGSINSPNPQCNVTACAGNEDIRNQPLHLVHSSLTHTEQGRGFSLTEVGAKTPPTVHPGSKSVGSSGSSSPSFVQISESDITAEASTSLKNKSPEHTEVLQAEQLVQMSADMSEEISQITEQMKKLGQTDSNCSGLDLSADLIRAGVHVLKLQKQNRVQQVLMEKMNADFAVLKADNADKERTIQLLRGEHKLLVERVKQMEASRGKALQEAHIRILETAAESDDKFTGPSLVEWVEVEKHQSPGASGEEAAAAGVDVDIVTATSLVEMELRRRIEKLSATITEVVTINRNWDEHCQEMEAKHNQQMIAMQARLAELQNRVDEYERSDQKRQQEFDSILLKSKQQRDAEEMAKEDALDQLHQERHLRTEVELKCIEFSRKTVELETQLNELQNSQQVYPRDHYMLSAVQHGQPMSAREQELNSQLIILQEQINVFKEDFDQERSDREATRTKMDRLRGQLTDTRTQMNALQTQLARANAELKTTKAENEQWRQRFQKLTEDLEALRRHARPIPQAPSRAQRFVLPTVAQPQYTYTGSQPQPAEIRRPSWPCAVCTFKNSGMRGQCDMCGRPKSRNVYQTDLPVGGRPVAGLQEYSPYLPYTMPVSRQLETDRVDDKQ